MVIGVGCVMGPLVGNLGSVYCRYLMSALGEAVTLHVSAKKHLKPLIPT